MLVVINLLVFSQALTKSCVICYRRVYGSDAEQLLATRVNAGVLKSMVTSLCQESCGQRQALSPGYFECSVHGKIIGLLIFD